jgi:hypothetical protein
MFFKEIFQDVDGHYSSKRTAFFIFVGLFVAIAVLVNLKAVDLAAVPILTATEDHLTELIKWLGGFILGEQAAKFAAPKEA